jgi:hypothetical protein
MEKRGKTSSITERFPSFYESGVESLFYQLVDVFGQMLEQAEMDLLRVMRSHYVDTADNEGSQGLLSAQKGDLDQIFVLYLEALGGTSQLIQVNRNFHSSAFIDFRGFVGKLNTGKDDLSAYLQKFFKSHSIPLDQNTPTSEFINILNQLLDDPNLYEENRQQFVEPLLTPETRRLIQLKPQKGKELQSLNRLLLEAAYPNEIKKSYEPYRERLKRLIQVLRRGAATRQGMIDIVAANLGIFGDDSKAAQDAKDKIEVVEYLPEFVTFDFSTLHLFEPIEISSSDPQGKKASIRLKVPSLPIAALVNPRVVNLTTKQAVMYQGELRLEDTLTFSEDGIVLLNGSPLPPERIVGTIPLLPAGTSKWQVEAQFRVADPSGYLEGLFDQSKFDDSTFDFTKSNTNSVGVFDQSQFDQSTFDFVQPEIASVGLFDQTNFDEVSFAFTEPAIKLEIEAYQEKPGGFEVKVPWDIPGFTDKFDESGDHPRRQIPAIINRVKAAGVHSIVTYEKSWRERHELIANLTLIGHSPFKEEHIIEEVDFDISNYQERKIQHDMSDKLVLSALFDYTGFDTGNGFA